MNRNSKGQFVKGHVSYKLGKFKWGTSVCKCGKVFKIVKRGNRFQESCSISCGMIGTKRSVGHKVSREARLKMMKSWFKKGTNYWTGKKRPEFSGENHPLWKGGITPINEKIRKSLEYKNWRDFCRKRDNYTCQFCGKRGGDLHVDHIKPFSLYPNLRFELSNGRTLCVPCHRKTETYGNYAEK